MYTSEELRDYLSREKRIEPAGPESREGDLAWLRSLARVTAPSAGPESSTTIEQLAKGMLAGHGASWDNACTTTEGRISQEGYARLAGSLTPSLEVMQKVWGLAAQPGLAVLDPLTFLRRVAPAQCREQVAAAADMVAAMRAILATLEHSTADVVDALGDSLVNDRPTSYFYEQLHGFLEREADAASSAGSSSGASGEDELSEIDEDEELDATAVEGQVKQLPITKLKIWIDQGTLNLSPPWQRGSVWSKKKQQGLVESLLLGIPLPSIILHERDGRFEIIDGKQRLTAVADYLDNKFSLRKYRESERDLFPRGGRYFSLDRRPLDQADRTKIEMTDIPVLLFKNVPERRLRRIFYLYNVSAVKLNQAEIRNAIYQHNKIHRMLFSVAGESLNPEYYLERARQTKLSDNLEKVGVSKKRFGRLDFFCRYLGYSRATLPPQATAFHAVSTTSIVNRYFDWQSSRESPHAVAAELEDAFLAAQDYFNIDEENTAFYVFDSVRGRVVFTALKAVTSMIAGMFLSSIVRTRPELHDAAKAAARDVSRRAVYPEGQQSSTIWDYQAQVVCGVVDAMNVDLKRLGLLDLSSVVDRLKQVRLTDEQRRVMRDR